MTRQTLLAAALATLITLSGSGCVASSHVTETPTATLERKCHTAVQAKDCGGVGLLSKEAISERTLVLAGDPGQSAHLKELADRFTRQYGIAVRWILPEDTTAERFEQTGRADYAGVQPDVFVLDPGSDQPPSDRVAAYRVVEFDVLIPNSAKDPDGHWVQVFGGVMSVGYNEDALGSQDRSGKFLSRSLTSGRLALTGDPASSASATNALLLLNRLNGEAGDSDAWYQSLKTQRIAAKRNLADLRSGRQTVVIDWNYAQEDLRVQLNKYKITWRQFVPDSAAIMGWVGMAINTEARHPAAARLWEEFLFSDLSQNYLLGGRAMPTGYNYLLYTGRISFRSRRLMPALLTKPITPEPTEVAAVRASAQRLWPSLTAGQ